ncbi:unnamed protein product [Thlaspi arvense]|uniref:Replication protein A 70 kDa DNA-binding subunit B/D first OB fold domain-containing protein n=1 Tax=Thlaspi arvense TaxID=13288 RepID=A0AAU9RZR7_THLAR|nr:unnamed protein product [Thlaspi arvense]
MISTTPSSKRSSDELESLPDLSSTSKKLLEKKTRNDDSQKILAGTKEKEKEKKWLTIDQDGVQSLHFVLIDERGDKIHGYINWEWMIPYFDQKMQEGEWKKIYNFTVIRVSNLVRLTETDKELSFLENTEVKRTKFDSEDHFQNFKSFDTLFNLDVPLQLPVDVIGKVTHVEDLQLVHDDLFGPHSPKQICRLKFTMVNNDDEAIQCVAFGKLAEDFNQHWYCLDDVKAVCVLSDWRLRIVNGVEQLMDDRGVSRFYFDLEIEEVFEFKENM